ncbi:MAG: redoxin domain-containing protein [Desulfarculaceae bacterium]|nr:redoxin domain-containing protein [Desulfarculaceae bacterium]MCF8048051.1 redoxin domain-containing protein [Desulfarculaceae bacterium]MCF8064904.1 redoxin domain-containing protein [Desulfarculaceae bacterium]MCF8097687.1 redoxin domain-containing protein [Desulfarculaceae bacterium]MCF8123717.1 redoxin domain-containing protein [Desulfarculaceae bacterium]
MLYKVLAAVLFGLILTAPLALAAGDQGKLKVGGPFPSAAFQAPEDPNQRAYLGLKPGEGLDPTKVDARLVIVEVLNIYCPHCQRQAPKVNTLYDLIQQNGWGDQVKMMGIGASNTGEEVAGYVRHYQVPFPVVPDYKVKCAELLGTVYTPYFVVFERLPGGANRVLYAASGELPPAKKFLEDMASQAGIK